jgi:hypothetical protein
MGVFRKQGVFWIDYDADGHHTCERIWLDKRLAETVHRKHKVEIAKWKYLDNYRLITTIFDHWPMHTSAMPGISGRNVPGHETRPAPKP